jgi:hypothetical protein
LRLWWPISLILEQAKQEEMRKDKKNKEKQNMNIYKF